jgi:hypothetical protein
MAFRARKNPRLCARGALRLRLGCWPLRATRRSPHGADGPTPNWTTTSRPQSRTLQTTQSLYYKRKIEKNCCATPWLGYRRNTARSLTSCIITGNRSARYAVATNQLCKLPPRGTNRFQDQRINDLCCIAASKFIDRRGAILLLCANA